MITFSELEIEGFCSIQKLTLNLNQPGLNLIQAPNGSGKTTIFSAFSWVLSGQTLKKTNKVNTWESYQPENYKGTKVGLTFEDSGKIYKVIRCSDYKKKVLGIKGKDRLILIEDGKERKDLRTKPITQKALTEILGYSFDLLTNSVIFGQKLKRIIQETGPNKKKIFEDAFEVTYINQAKKLASDKKDKVQEEFDDASHKLDNLNTRLSELKDRLKAAEEAKAKFKQGGKAEISVIKANIRIQKKKIGNPQQLKLTIGHRRDQLKGLRSERLSRYEKEQLLFRLEMDIKQAEGGAENYTREIEKLKSAFPLIRKNCLKCGAKLNKAAIQKERDSIKADIKSREVLHIKVLNRIRELLINQKSLLVHVSRLKHIETDISKCENDIDALEANLKQQEKAQLLIKQYQEQIGKIKRRKFVISVKELKKKVENLNNEIEPLQTEVHGLRKKLDTYKWLIKVPLSNSGIKAFIFEYMIGLVNEQLENYEKIIGFRINFGIDMDTAKRDFVTTITRNKSIQSYDEISGGEQQLVDVALAFAIHDITSIEKPVNLLLIDEIFESLDVGNIELVTELVQQKAQQKALWLVTHQSTFNPSGCRIVRLEKPKKFTKLVE